MCRVANPQSRLPRATSSLALDAPSLDAFTTYLGNLFQCITTLWVKRLGCNGFKLKEGRFWLDIRKKFLTLKVVRHWN